MQLQEIKQYHHKYQIDNTGKLTIQSEGKDAVISYRPCSEVIQTTHD
jgi:hypothetical protein